MSRPATFQTWLYLGIHDYSSICPSFYYAISRMYLGERINYSALSLFSDGYMNSVQLEYRCILLFSIYVISGDRVRSLPEMSDPISKRDHSESLNSVSCVMTNKRFV